MIPALMVYLTEVSNDDISDNDNTVNDVANLRDDIEWDLDNSIPNSREEITKNFE